MISSVQDGEALVPLQMTLKHDCLPATCHDIRRPGQALAARSPLSQHRVTKHAQQDQDARRQEPSSSSQQGDHGWQAVRSCRFSMSCSGWLEGLLVESASVMHAFRLVRHMPDKLRKSGFTWKCFRGRSRCLSYVHEQKNTKANARKGATCHHANPAL